MKTVFVFRDGSTAIPTTVYPGPTSPGSVIEYGGDKFTITDTPAFTRRVTRHSSVGDEWERVVQVEKAAAVTVPVKAKGKDKQNSSAKALFKE